ncbi:hypothetical protein CA54_16800 [Symmachiella macrocystis]|uniref:Phage-related minor tail protein n=2 Tax=Symmachiella macrocystis TaxID=2527985 RepID=A0A5C6BQE7_9PLAN|nr:hypothetical protein CA54_16800 [Symmachiella macrocystis]
MAGSRGIRAGRAFLELFADDTKLAKGLKRAQQRLTAFGAGVSKIGAGITALGAGLAAPLLGAAKLFASTGDQLDKMRQRTGLSAKTISQLGFAAEQSGASIDQMDRSLAAMARFSVMVERDLSTATDVLDMLGVSVADFKALNPEGKFKLLAEGISNVEDPTVRAGLALNVFGRSGRELLPMLNGGAAGIEKLQKEAEALGITMSEDDATSAAELTDAMNRLRRQFGAIVTQVGSALAPALVAMQSKIAPIVTKVINWVKENKNLIVGVFKLAVAAVAIGTAIAGIGGAFALAGAAVGGVVTVMSAIGSVLGVLLSPIGLVAAAVIGLGVYWVKMSESGGQALAWLMGKFGELKARALGAFEGIRDAIAGGDMKLAAKVMWLYLKSEFVAGLNVIKEKWAEFKSFFVETWEAAVFAMSSMMLDAWSVLESGWVHTVDFLYDAWAVMANGVLKAWNNSAGYIEKSWIRLKGLFDEGINVDAQIAAIDAVTAGDNAAIDNAQNEAVFKRDQDRQAKLAQIEADRAGAQAELKSEAERQAAERAAGFAAEMEANEKALADARAEFEAAKGEAKKKADAAGITIKDIPGLDEAVSAGSGLKDGKVSTKGTFSAFAAAGLGGSSTADRTAKATEETAKHTKAMAKRAAAGLKFG